MPELLSPGCHPLSFRGCDSDSSWQLEFSIKVALRDYLMSPCARWCGRALSSSWKLPPRGARRARPGGGRGAEGTRTPPVPGEGSAPPPSSPRGGEGRRERGRGGSGARKRGGGAASRPTPRLENNGFPLLPPAAHSAPHPAPLPGPERGVGGAAAAGAVGTGAETYKN